MRELRCAGRREDTQQGTLATGVARDCGDVESVAGWPSGRERNGLQPGQGATELGFPRPAPGEMQSEAARRAGDPSHQSEDPPPEGLGDHGPLAQTNPRRPVRVTSAGSTSVLTPRKTGTLKMLSLVRSANVTLATSSGRTELALRNTWARQRWSNAGVRFDEIYHR